MAGNKDFIDIIREIRGSAAPGQPLTDGIWYELTVADKNGNPGVYGDILAKYGIVTESAGTFDQAVAILENLNVEVTTLPAGTSATSALVNGVWQIGIPAGADGIDGIDGFTPELAIAYNLGNLNYTVTVNGVQVTNSVLLNLDNLVNTKVSENVDVQTTLVAKQEVLDAVADAQGLVDSLDASVVIKKQEIATYTAGKIDELDTASANEKLEITTHADTKVSEYNTNAATKTSQYNSNHTTKLAAYNTNDVTKLAQYNGNHITRLTEFNEAYAKRLIEMLEVNKLFGAVDQFIVQTTTQQVKFISTVGDSYLYYVNGVQITENIDYTVFNNTTIDLVVPVNPNDVVIQIATSLLTDLLIGAGQLTLEDINVPNGVAGLDGTGKVAAAQLPSYVDDVVEVATYADLPITGESDKIYIVVADENSGGDTSSYRWTGSTYAMVSNTLTAQDVKDLYESIVGDIVAQIGTKQDTLVNQVNIKSVNGENILGSGDLNITIGSGGYAANVYLTNLVSTTNGAYKQLSYTPDVAEVIASGVANNNEVLIYSSIFDGDVRATAIPSGEWGFHFHRSVDNTAQESKLRFEVFKRSSIGDETVLFSTTSKDINDVTYVREDLLVTQPVYLVNETDRIGLKVYASTTRTSNTTISFKVGDGEASFINTPLQIRHNQLRARDENDSHPISAITGLQSELDNRVIKNANITAGTYKSITVDEKGLVTDGTNPSTLSGFGITDAYTQSQIDSVNLFQADKYLAAQKVVNMTYNINGKLSKVQYNTSTDVDYEVLTYNGDGKLSNVAHYVGGVLQGNTVLSYSNGRLVSAPFTAV